jgi:hypothetical protein
MSATTTADAVAHVLQLECELQTKACRNNRTRVLELLAPEFTEVGASGRLWDLTSTLDLLDSQSDDAEEIEVANLSGLDRCRGRHLGAVGLVLQGPARPAYILMAPRHRRLAPSAPPGNCPLQLI